ncbi:enoyl-CoA hydratase/isomerase family protein [Chryseobacterium gleum]|uniref:enoyl-CoA hydratase/isomerase family protein n=1 Tax=Chryseobacterium gleum TaxID=250 RepID=UPI00241DD97C|nr:enoyl-CoA hydratase/isomerase family protein [Chryseobacterium gleum]
MDELEANENLKVVVFESSNPEFYVAHAELVNIFNFPKGEGKTGLSKSWPDVAKRLEQAPFVSIASIRGRARGLGSEFIQAFDMRFASKEKAFFAQPEIGIGSFSRRWRVGASPSFNRKGQSIGDYFEWRRL